MKQITRGIQALDSKELIDTVEESKNRGPGSMYKDLSPQIQRCNLCFSKENIRSKQNPNPNVAAATEYMRFRSWMTPWNRPYGLQDDTQANGPKDCVVAA